MTLRQKGKRGALLINSTFQLSSFTVTRTRKMGTNSIASNVERRSEKGRNGSLFAGLSFSGETQESVYWARRGRG
jgi:hypothetical protein